jgi:hypothetical protein
MSPGSEFFQNNAELMLYAEFLGQWIFVGSAVVEAGCKTVIGGSKQSQMRWNIPRLSLPTQSCCWSGDSTIIFVNEFPESPTTREITACSASSLQE